MLAQKVAVVTGAARGIGLAVARDLAASGCRVVMVGRGAEAIENAARELCDSGHQVIPHVADVTDASAVAALAARLRREFRRVDILINNAGVILLQRQVTEDGLEMTLAVNHLAPFLLTSLLLDLLKKSAPARILTMSSTVHYDARIDLDKLQSERGYNGVVAYKDSKLGNVLFTLELAERLRGSGVTANCLHPGVPTETTKSSSSWT